MGETSKINEKQKSQGLIQKLLRDRFNLLVNENKEVTELGKTLKKEETDLSLAQTAYTNRFNKCKSEISENANKADRLADILVKRRKDSAEQFVSDTKRRAEVSVCEINMLSEILRIGKLNNKAKIEDRKQKYFQSLEAINERDLKRIPPLVESGCAQRCLSKLECCSSKEGFPKVLEGSEKEALARKWFEALLSRDFFTECNEELCEVYKKDEEQINQFLLGAFLRAMEKKAVVTRYSADGGEDSYEIAIDNKKYLLDEEGYLIPPVKENEFKKNKDIFLTSDPIRLAQLRKAQRRKDEATKIVEQKANNQIPKELLNLAQVAIDASDVYFLEKRTEEGDSLLKNALFCVDTALDFVSGISAAKDIITISAGINPVTLKRADDVERSVLAGSFFVPSVIKAGGAAVVKAAKALVGVIKRGGKGATEAEKLLGVIKKADADLGGSVLGASQQPGKAVDELLEVGEALKGVSKEVGDVAKVDGLARKVFDSAKKYGFKNSDDVKNVADLCGKAK